MTITTRHFGLVLGTTLALGLLSGCASNAAESLPGTDDTETEADALTVKESVGIWSGSAYDDGVAGTKVYPELHIYRDRSFVLTYARCQDADITQCTTLSLAQASTLRLPEYKPAPMQGDWRRALRIEFETDALNILNPGSGFGPRTMRPVVITGQNPRGAEVSLRLFHTGEDAKGRMLGQLNAGRSSHYALGSSMVKLSNEPSPTLTH